MTLAETIALIQKDGGKTAAEASALIQAKMAEFSGLLDAEGSAVLVAKDLGVTLPAEPSQAAPAEPTAQEQDDPHYTFLEMCSQDSAYHQEYTCVITKVDPEKSYTMKDGTQKTVQDIHVSDGTATMKLAIWGGTGGRVTAGMGLQMGGVYFKRNPKGYLQMGVAKEEKGGYKKYLPAATVQQENPMVYPVKGGGTNTDTAARPVATGGKTLSGQEINDLRAVFETLWINIPKKLQEQIYAANTAAFERLNSLIG